MLVALKKMPERIKEKENEKKGIAIDISGALCFFSVDVNNFYLSRPTIYYVAIRFMLLCVMLKLDRILVMYVIMCNVHE